MAKRKPVNGLAQKDVKWLGQPGPLNLGACVTDAKWLLEHLRERPSREYAIRDRLHDELLQAARLVALVGPRITKKLGARAAESGSAVVTPIDLIEALVKVRSGAHVLRSIEIPLRNSTTSFGPRGSASREAEREILRSACENVFDSRIQSAREQIFMRLATAEVLASIRNPGRDDESPDQMRWRGILTILDKKKTLLVKDSNANLAKQLAMHLRSDLDGYSVASIRRTLDRHRSELDELRGTKRR